MNMKKEKRQQIAVIEGFSFYTTQEAEQAKKEQEGIRYLKSKADLSKPQTVLSIYNRAIDQELFETPVGMQFLHEMREYLIANPSVREEELLPIPVFSAENASSSQKNGKIKRQKGKKSREDGKDGRNANHPGNNGKKKESSATRRVVDYRKKYHISLYINVILVVIIAAMFVITATSKNNITILNYENELINKYEQWEEELAQREEALKQREEAAAQ